MTSDSGLLGSIRAEFLEGLVRNPAQARMNFVLSGERLYGVEVRIGHAKRHWGQWVIAELEVFE